MKNFLKKTIQTTIFTIAIFVIFFTLGYGINYFTGIKVFSITKNETINVSSVIELILLFISVLISRGIFQNDGIQNKLSKIISDSEDIVIEIDKNMLFVPEYEFKKKGTQLDIREAEINYISTVYHFDFLVYNKTLTEATVKEIRMYIGKKNPKKFIAKSIAEKCETGYRDAGPFKQFMILKGKSVENKITFKEIDNDNTLLINEYILDMNNIEFVVEYNIKNKTKHKKKNIVLDIKKQDIEKIKNYSKTELANKIIGKDRKRFVRECLTDFGNYYCVKGLNHEFKVK